MTHAATIDVTHDVTAAAIHMDLSNKHDTVWLHNLTCNGIERLNISVKMTYKLAGLYEILKIQSLSKAAPHSIAPVAASSHTCIHSFIHSYVGVHSFNHAIIRYVTCEVQITSCAACYTGGKLVTCITSCLNTSMFSCWFGSVLACLKT